MTATPGRMCKVCRRRPLRLSPSLPCSGLCFLVIIWFLMTYTCRYKIYLTNWHSGLYHSATLVNENELPRGKASLSTLTTAGFQACKATVQSLNWDEIVKGPGCAIPAIWNPARVEVRFSLTAVWWPQPGHCSPHKPLRGLSLCENTDFSWSQFSCT